MTDTKSERVLVQPDENGCVKVIYKVSKDGIKIIDTVPSQLGVDEDGAVAELTESGMICRYLPPKIGGFVHSDCDALAHGSDIDEG